jgi:hypothetical protein
MGATCPGFRGKAVRDLSLPRYDVRHRSDAAFHYRCNWWAVAAGDPTEPGPHLKWSGTSLHRVRKSWLLRVTSRPAGLSIEEVAGEEPRGDE